MAFGSNFINQLWSALLFIAVVSTRLTTSIQYKPYSSTLTVACSGCDDDHCLVTINDVSVEGFAVADGLLVLPAYNWNVYGTVCCGVSSDQTLCHQICPIHREKCEECLHISSNTVTVTEGSMVEVSCSFAPTPHNGISVMVNGSINGDADMRCTLRSNQVLGNMVNYTCAALRPGMKSLQATLDFCDSRYHSAPLLVNIEEPRNTSVPPLQTTRNTSVVVPTNLIVPTPTFDVAVNTTSAPAHIIPTVSTSLLPTNKKSIETDGGDGLSEGAIIAIVLSITLAIALVIFAIVIIVLTLRQRRATDIKTTISTSIFCLPTYDGSSTEDQSNTVGSNSNDRRTDPETAQCTECTSAAGFHPLPDQSSHVPVDEQPELHPSTDHRQ